MIVVHMAYQIELYICKIYRMGIMYFCYKEWWNQEELKYLV